MGTMTLTGGYGPIAQADALDVLRYAIDAGVALLDTADAYLGGEELVAQAVHGRVDRPLIVTKCGLGGEPGRRWSCGRPDYLAQACAASRQRLRVETLDAILLHRVDPLVPVEESIGALAALREQGLVAQIGICTSDPAVVRRSAAIAPLAFVEAPLSILNPEPAKELLAAVRSADAVLLAHSPLVRGVAAKHSSKPSYEPGDARAHIPELRDHALLSRAARLARDAQQLGISRVALALGWLVSLGPDVVPLPGVRTRRQSRESLDAQRDLPPDVSAAVAAFF